MHAAAGAHFPVITLQPSTKLRNLSCGGCGKVEKTMPFFFKKNKIAPNYKDETYLCISKFKPFERQLWVDESEKLMCIRVEATKGPFCSINAFMVTSKNYQVKYNLFVKYVIV